MQAIGAANMETGTQMQRDANLMRLSADVINMGLQAHHVETSQAHQYADRLRAAYSGRREKWNHAQIPISAVADIENTYQQGRNQIQSRMAESFRRIAENLAPGDRDHASQIKQAFIDGNSDGSSLKQK